MFVRQHIPAFIEADPVKIEVETLDDLLHQKFVRCFQESAQFHRFSIERGYYPPDGLALLVAEFWETPYWWVVCYIQGDISSLSELPDFEPTKIKPADMN